MSYQRLMEISDDLIEGAIQYPYKRAALFAGLEPPSKNVVILKGARGIGKSTLIQQFLVQKKNEGAQVFYISADSTLLTVGLAELAREYYKRGGLYLAIDEIHKCLGWQAEVKTILDSFPKLKLIVSGSSSLNLDYAAADLSRRHIMLHAQGLSFREYVAKNCELDFSVYSLSDTLASAEGLSAHITKTFRVHNIDLLALFNVYLREGYFLSRENYHSEVTYYNSLLNSINSIIDADLPNVHQDIDRLSRQRIKLLLKHIAIKCPFTPNISELSRHLNVSGDNMLKKYLYYLSEGEIITNLYAANKSHKDFQKPQKIFLNNTNFAYAFSPTPLIGTIRETFVANCLKLQGELTAPTYGDFCLNGEWTFEVGGRSKNHRQLKSIKNSYVFADDIMSVENGNVPLWLLGFLW